MPRTAKRLIYVEPDLDTRIRERAKETGISVNEWFNRIAEHYLSQKSQTVTYTERREITF